VVEVVDQEVGAAEAGESADQEAAGGKVPVLGQDHASADPECEDDGHDDHPVEPR
jgi:hypothetical protein